MNRFLSLRLTHAGAFLAAAIIAFAFAASPARADDVVVFAAASLKNALDAVAGQYSADTGKTVSISYAGSNTLAKQIMEGAPADIFFSADLAWMDEVDNRSLLRPGTRTTLLGNTLVLIAPETSGLALTLARGFDLKGALGSDGRLAMANVDSVPAGKYGKAALMALGAWDSVASKVAQADNVRGALAFVARGEAPLGIVYQTDANAEPAVKVVGAFPEASHPPIVYPVAILASSTNPDTQGFFDYLKSGAAKEVFVGQGFTVVAPSG